jgi:xanthine phosphoribosyltransferase
MIYYKYDTFIEDIENLSKQIQNFKPDIILAVARGGVTIGHFLAEKLKLRDLYALNSIHYDDTKKLDTIKIFNIPDLPSDKKVLVVDDIVDSGESMQEIMRTLHLKYPKTTFKTAVIFYKKDAIFTPDFMVKNTTDWIEFFWTSPQKNK